MQELKKLQKLEAQYKDAYQKGDFIQAQKFHLEIAKMRSKPKLMKLNLLITDNNESNAFSCMPGCISDKSLLRIG